jgi:hypothetical protein
MISYETQSIRVGYSDILFVVIYTICLVIIQYCTAYYRHSTAPPPVYAFVPK